MHETPPVIVCVPVRNGARTIQRTLDSILAQDYPNIEVIVSDNSSTDDTARIVQKYSAYGVRYYLNPKLEACGESNWNYILSLAQSRFIALYHADDIYTPTMVRRQVDFLEAHADASAVFTMTRMIDEQDRPIRLGTIRLPKELRGQECFEFQMLFNAVLKYSNFLTVPTLMTKREALDAVGVFDLRFRTAADIDLWLRLSRWGPVGVIDEPLHCYRISAQQGSAQINRMRTVIADFFQVLNDYLTRPEVSQIVQPDALAFYELERSADQLLCTRYLLVQGRVAEAQTRMKEALQWQHWRTALRRPRRLLSLATGMCLLASTQLGAGILAGRWLNRVAQWKWQQLIKPAWKIGRVKTWV